MYKEIPCCIMRGGTSKGLFLLDKHLPPQGEERNAALLKLMGSPDARQIDGLGGATSTTSKAAILSPSDRRDIDVLYTFAQVAIEQPFVSYAGNCGNISSGVGAFAIESGLVAAQSPVTTVRIWNENTKKLLVEEIQTPNGKVSYEGSFNISGVKNPAAPVKMKFLDPAGSMGMGLLPTGKAVEVLNVEGFGEIEVSIVDATNPLVFIRACDVGMDGTDSPSAIDSDTQLLETLEKIRGEAAKKLGLVDDAAEATAKSPGIPKMTIVSRPRAYTATTGETIPKEEIDIVSRMMSMQKAHPTYAMTGAMCTAAAAVIPGSIVAQMVSEKFDPAALHIGQPSGVLVAGVEYGIGANDDVLIRAAFGFRTARLLMKGTAYIE